MTTKKPLKREVDALAARYRSFSVRFGEHNLATQRAWQVWYEAREAREG